jgi:hypothetical protein
LWAKAAVVGNANLLTGWPVVLFSSLPDEINDLLALDNGKRAKQFYFVCWLCLGFVAWLS